MRNLIRFVLRYNFPILFLAFEFIAILFIFSHNPIPRGRLSNQVNSISSVIYDKTYALTQYMNLRRANEQLAMENSYLRGHVPQSLSSSQAPERGYQFTPAHIVNNSVQNEFNYLTLSVGSNSGIEPEMAVVSSFGIVGVVKSVSPNFCRVISILNTQLRISVKLSKSGHFGSLSWDRRNYRTVLVTEIPSHVSLEPGDSIVTSGYSSIFPPGEPVAIVLESSPAAGGNFLEIKAQLCNDFMQLSTVYIVRNTMKEEIQDLEESSDEK